MKAAETVGMKRTLGVFFFINQCAVFQYFSSDSSCLDVCQLNFCLRNITPIIGTAKVNEP